MNLNSIFAHIRGQVNQDSLTNSCGGEQCTVHHDDIPKERVIINVEKEFDARGDNRKRCDRLLFYKDGNTLIAVPIELKGRGKGGESQVLAQLESGLEFAATLVPDKHKTRYVPIVFTKRGIKWTSKKRQKRELKVEFQGKPLRVFTGTCGRKENLAGLLFNAGYLNLNSVQPTQD